MAKIKIIYNNKTKIIPITEKFNTDLRVWYEFANMCLETMFSKVPDRYMKTPIIELPSEVMDDILAVTEVEKQYYNYEDKMILRLIRKIETNFKVKIKKNSFHFLTYDLDEEDKKNDIVHVFDCFDVKED